ncbi:hypothetical protein G6K96_21590 [Agrobacterium vitis]|uniref:portal protein n=1 Tax=Agrobacterium vitis TaxID=373 RepID=UPI00157194B9|nr:portal protein [Agrobacterium vitis]NTA34328.1 hypothetical protein [Agrobacterium vitis]
MSDQAGRDLLEIDTRLFAAKENIDSLYQSICEYFYPERAEFTTEIQYGDEFASHLIDSYPVYVRRELGNSIGSMVRDGDWFKATVTNQDVMRKADASSFLEFMTTVNRAILYSRDSGYRRAASLVEHDWAAIGMGWMQVSFNKARDNLIFRNHHPKLCAAAEGPDGHIWHVHRKADMNAISMAHQFGEDKLTQPMRDKLKEKDFKTCFKVRHCFVPLEIYEPYRKFPKWAKWADVYVTEEGKILQELPAATFDYVVPRWQTISGKVYAFSPASIIALPDARMIQRMMLSIIEAAEKANDPPLVAVQDAILSEIDMSSAGITYIDAEYDERMGAAIRPIDLGKNPSVGEKLIVDVRQKLSDAFFLNKLTPLANAQRTKTAYEASQLVQEYIRQALPLFEPIDDEWTGATLDLVTEKVMRSGGYGPVDKSGVPVDMPDALRGQNLVYEFNNALQQARDQQKIEGFKQGADLTAIAAQMDQSIVQEVDMRTAFRDAFSVVPGSRVDWLRSEEEAQQLAQQSQQQAQMQQQMAMVGQGAEIAGQVGNAAQQLQGVI